MKKTIALIIRSLIIAVFILFTGKVQAVHAQYFKFDISELTQPVPVGSNFSVKVFINTAGTPVIAGDALIIFDPDKVSINSAESGNFFTYFSGTALGGVNNKYLVSGWEESVASAKTASSDKLFATLNLTAKVNGSAVLTFDCTSGSEADSNINEASDSKDIIKCNQMSPVTITMGTGGPTSAPTFTPVPTASASATSTPVPPTLTPTKVAVPTISALPRSGVMEMTFAALGIGVLFTVVGILLIL